MKTIRLNIFLAIGMLIVFVGCTKEAGFGGDNEISGLVKLNSVSIEGAIVHIVVGATEATKNYTTSTVTDASGIYYFKGLKKGDYFVDAIYTNSNGMRFEAGGALIKIGEKKGTVTADLIVE